MEIQKWLRMLPFKFLIIFKSNYHFLVCVYLCVFIHLLYSIAHFTICDWPAFLSLISRHWLQTIHDPQQLYTMCLQSPAIYLSIVFYGFECKLIRLSDIPVRNFEQLIVVWIHWLQPTIDRSIAWLNQLQCFWKRAISEMATKKTIAMKS